MIKNLLIVLFAIGTLAGAAASSFLYLRYSSSRPIMRVGGDVITRKEFQERVEYAAGKPVLNKIVYHKIILQSAKKAGVLANDKDVDARIADIDRRTPGVLEAARRDPIKMAEMRGDMLSDISFENLRIKSVNLSDAEIKTFYDQNKNLFGVPDQAQTTLVVAQNSVDAETAKGLLAQGIKPETIARQPRLAVVGVNGFQINQNQIPPQLADKLNKAVFGMKEGDIIAVPAGANFLVIRLNKRAVSGVPPFDSIRPLVTRMAKLAQAAPQDAFLAKLYKDANVVFEVGKYSDYFSDVQAKADEKPALGTKSGPKSANPAVGVPVATARP